MRAYWDFFAPQKLLFGSGVVEQLAHELRRHAWTRVLIITDPCLRHAGVLNKVLSAIGEAAITEVFEGGEPEPSIQAALDAAAHAVTFNPDVILGLGGGSNMDLAKITAILHRHGGHPSDYFSFDRVPGPVTPVLAIPTTSGTGSEVSHAAVLTDPSTHLKVSTLSPFLRPALALVDPHLTWSCPPHVTAESGMDALVHAVEAFCARDPGELEASAATDLPYPGKNPLADAFAEKAIRLIAHHLRTAVAEPQHAAAREGMSLAATLAGLAFSNAAVAVVHALEYPMGVALHCSHGLGNGLLLPYVMRYNLPVRRREIAQIGSWLGCDTTGRSEQDAAEMAIEAVATLKRDVGLPERIRDIGGRQEQLEDWATKALGIQRLMDLNPRKPSKEDLLGILLDVL